VDYFFKGVFFLKNIPQNFYAVNSKAHYFDSFNNTDVEIKTNTRKKTAHLKGFIYLLVPLNLPKHGFCARVADFTFAFQKCLFWYFEVLGMEHLCRRGSDLFSKF
jgi:hypothetical protein